MDDAVVRAFASLQCGSVQILASTQHLSLFGLSLFLALSFAPRGFSPVYPVFHLLKIQQFQIPIRSATHGHVLTSSSELLSPRCVNKLIFFLIDAPPIETLVCFPLSVTGVIVY